MDFLITNERNFLSWSSMIFCFLLFNFSSLAQTNYWHLPYNIDKEKNDNFISQSPFHNTDPDSLLLENYYQTSESELHAGDYKGFLSTVKEILMVSDSIDNKLYLNKVNLLLGRYYIQLSDYSMAQEYLLKAQNYFERTQDSFHLAKTYNSLGILYFQIANYEKSKYFLEKSYQIYIEEKDIKGEAVYYANIGNIYMIEKDYVQARKCQEKSLETFSKINDTINIVSCLINLSNINSNTNQNEQALQLLDEAISLTTESSSNAKLKERILYNYGLIYYNQKEYDKALLSLDEHKVLVDQYNFRGAKLDGIELYSKIAKQEQDFQKALHYTEKYVLLKDSLLGAEVKNKVEELKWKNDFEKSQIENELLQSKYNIELEQNKYLVLSVVSVVVLLVMLFFLSWLIYRNNLKKIEIVKMNNEMLQDAISKEQLNSAKEKAENDLLKLRTRQQTLELQMKNREMTSVSLQLLSKNAILGEIRKILNRKNKSIPNVERDLKTILRQHKNQEENLNQFNEVFEKVHPQFLKNLKENYPQLSSTDIRICSYIKIGMTTTEVANLLNITLQSVHTSRYRIRKKLNLLSGQELDDFIQKIDKN